MRARVLFLTLLLATPLFADRRHAVQPVVPFVPESVAPVDVFSAAEPAQVLTTHVDLDLDVDFDKYQVRGSVTETINNLTGATKFVVDTRNLTITGVKIDGVSTKWSLSPSFLSVGRPLTVDIKPSTRVVRIDYTSSADPKAAALNWLAPLATDGDVAPFFYTFTEPDHTRDWIPIQDSPAVRVTYNAHIRVPRGLLAVMSADHNPTVPSTNGEYSFSMTKPIPPYLIALAIGRMQFHPLSERTGFYAEPENVAAAIEDLGYVPSMLDAAERLLGPYPFDRYDIVLMPPAYRAGGMENPNANFINVLSASPGNHQPQFSSVVAHEMAHSWMGDLVTCATWNDTWLNEGFATYYQGRILDEMNALDRAELERYFARTSYDDYVHATTQAPQVTVMHRSFERSERPSTFNTASYQKGALFLRMIEDSAGRAVFDGFVREWLKRYRFHWVDDRAFVQLFRERVGLPEAYHLDEWLYGTGFPPNITVPASAALWTRAAEAATAFAGGKSLESLGASTWTPIERDLFLWAGFSALAPHIGEVETTLQMSSLNTASINWWAAIASTLYTPALPSFERFLRRGGGNVLSIFQRLAATSEGMKYALAVYPKVRPHYDVWTQESIDRMLHYNPTALRTAA